MSLGMAIWAGIKTVKMMMETNPLSYQGTQPLHPDLKNQVTKILARSFRLNGNAVLNVIAQHLGKMGIDLGNFNSGIEATRGTKSPEEIQFLSMMHVTADSCLLMVAAADKIEQGLVDTWIRKQPCKVPKGLKLDNFTLCDPDLPETVGALKQVIFTTLCAMDGAGLGTVPWHVVSTDPCLRGMLGIEDLEETILTRFEVKKKSWSSEETMSFSLHQVLETGCMHGKWWIFTSKDGF